MDCYVVCNMFPPLVTDVVRAPGLRAQQLAHQAAPHFDRVRYVMTRSRFNMLTRAPVHCRGVRSHPDFIVIHDDHIEAFCRRLPRSAFVFSQTEMPAVFAQAVRWHYVIYDILAPKVLELRCGGAPEDRIAKIQEVHERFARRAHRVLVNGDKNLGLFAEDLARRDDAAVNNPFCPVTPPLPDGFTPGRRHILFFSGAQKWTDNTEFLRAMADCLSERLDVKAYFLSRLKHHEDPESPAISRLVQLPNVRRIAALSYPAHLALLGRTAAAMDWSSVNEERLYSTSTRLIQAVSGGVAIFGNAGTGLDHYWGGYPGEAAGAPPTAEQLSGFIDSALAGGFAAGLDRAQAWCGAVLADPSVFGGIA